MGAAMAKPVKPQDMFDMWQKMVNPGAYPLQSLMFPVLDPKELEKKIGELEVVEHWLKANLNMLGLTIKSLQYQRAMLKGGEKFREEMATGGAAQGAPGAGADNPAMWAWDMMARAGENASPAGTASPRAGARKKKGKPGKKAGAAW
jgi:hypothetical protein